MTIEQFRRLLAVLGVGLLLVGCDSDQAPPPALGAEDVRTENAGVRYAAVNAGRIESADSEPRNWLTHGRTYGEQRFSPLSAINDANVGELGLAWYYDIPTRRGIEATPIVVDGVMYSTGSWSMVYANDARSGELLWSYDPKVPREWAGKICCDVVNRGVAVWDGAVYFGTIDGRLIALDAGNGRPLWSVQTTDTSKPYSITGAPRAVRGRIIIGNGGAEFGVRGYVSAYDSKTGDLNWRFYTVPGNPSDPPEMPILATAAKTWTGEWWKYGGGGTVWDSMAYDPELDLLYIGVGNGSPWNHQIRSPGGGDNLFLSSIVALRPDTGEYVWHYQTTPADSWDYTATQHMILADLDWGGESRKVLMQAPKNGFFYVLDRTSGELLSAKPYVTTTWATHVDIETGRPVENDGARFRDNPVFAMPGPGGAHNWHPMSYSPDTGLVYIPAQELPFVYAHDPNFTYTPGFWNTGVQVALGMMPEDPAQAKAVMAMVKGEIIAWDPVQEKEVWRVQFEQASNGGLLSTAGNLVFQGNALGEFVAYRATDGERLWGADAQTGVVAAPISYAVKGQQYVSVMAGWGGSWPLVGGETLKKSARRNISRILTYRVGGNLELPPYQDPVRELKPPPMEGSAELIAAGRTHYLERCGACHGDGVVSGGVIPDLRYSIQSVYPIWDNIVRDGILKHNGMVAFDRVLDEQQSASIRAYVIARAHKLAAENAAAGTQPPGAP